MSDAPPDTCVLGSLESPPAIPHQTSVSSYGAMYAIHYSPVQERCILASYVVFYADEVSAGEVCRSCVKLKLCYMAHTGGGRYHD